MRGYIVDVDVLLGREYLLYFLWPMLRLVFVWTW